MKTAYDILQISSEATPAQIKSAYRKLAKLYHPDVNKSPDAAQLFQILNKAFEELQKPVYQAPPNSRKPPVKRTTGFKFYEFLKDSQTTVTLSTGMDHLVKDSCIYLMWKNQEFRVRFDEDKLLPFAVKLVHPPVLLRVTK